MSTLFYKNSMYIEAADPNRDRNYRKQALDAWDAMMKYLANNRPFLKEGVFHIYFWFFAQEYGDLVLLVDSKRATSRGSFGPTKTKGKHSGYGIELYILPEDFWEYDEERAYEELPYELQYAKDTFVHEFIHYLDRKRRTIPQLSSKEMQERQKRRTDRQRYLSNPEEFNAWYQTMAQQLERTLQRIPAHTAAEQVATFESFFKFVERDNAGYWEIDQLDEKYHKKLMSRLYGLWKHLRSEYADD